jgi:DNA invertase Pin-like site-specific DNA recombinase
MERRAAIYVRVSTDKQTIENQLRELRQIAERRGWQVVEEFHDAGISGAKAAKTVLASIECFRTRNDAALTW